MTAAQNTLPELLLALRRRINEESKQHSPKYELTMSQFEVLWFIESEEKKSMESIAEYLGVKPPSVTAMIDKMEREGLVKRHKDSKDRRVVYIELTAKTKRQFTQMRTEKTTVLTKLLSKISKHDCDTLVRILSALTA